MNFPKSKIFQLMNGIHKPSISYTGGNNNSFEREKMIFDTIGSRCLPAPGQSLVRYCKDLAVEINPQKFNLMTWNIRHGTHLDKVIGYIDSIDRPDLLCLQEIDMYCGRSGNSDLVHEIAKKLGYAYSIFTTSFVELDDLNDDLETHQQKYPGSRRHHPSVGRGGGVSGTAVFSKAPITGVQTIELPRHYDYEDKSNLLSRYQPMIGGCMATIVDLPFMRLVHSHFTNMSGLSQRIKNMKLLRKAAKPHDQPTVFVGDLNTGTEGIGQYIDETSIHNWWKIFGRSVAGYDKYSSQLGFFGKAEAKLFNEIALMAHKLQALGKFESTYRFAHLFRRKLDWIIINSRLRASDVFYGPWGISDHRAMTAQLAII